jgi:Glycosyltransferase family 87
MRRAAPYVAHAALWVLLTTTGPFADIRVNDFFVYTTYADLMRDGAVPFRDFAFEYPPLAALPMLAMPSAFWFGAIMLSSSLVAQFCAARLAGARGELVAWLLVAQPILIGASLRTHFDALAVALMLAGLALVVADRPVLGLAVLGLATMTKLFPAVLVPGVLLWLLARRRDREAVRGLAAFAAVVVVLALPFAGHGLVDMATFHLDRPVQIESSPASVLWAIGDSYVTGTDLRPDRYKSNGLAGGPAGAVQTLFTLLQIGALLAAIPLARRDLVLSAAASVLAFVALGKVLSPQYVIWLAPFAALCWARGERLAGALIAAGVGLTQVEFPRHYLDLVNGETWVVLVVALRNATLLAALALILLSGRRAAAAARSRPRAFAASPG